MGIGEGVKGGYKCMKYTLAFFNFIVLLLGGIVLGVGIYLLVSDYGVKEMAAILGSDLFKASVYLMIATGAITLLISFMGCCGACMESRCLLGMYFGIMLILIFITIAICIIGFVFKNNITGHLQREAETTLLYKYGKDRAVTDEWDRIQQQLKCCGVTGGQSSNTSWAIYKLESDWFKDLSAKQYVPDSCCEPEENLAQCTGQENGEGRPPKDGPAVSLPNNPFLYTDGCYDKLDDFLNKNALIIGGVALAAIFIMVIGVTFSICLCIQIGRQGYIV